MGKFVTELKTALIELGATDVSGDSLKDVLKSGLGSITGNTLTGNTISEVVSNFNSNHAATVIFDVTPAETTIVVKSGANVIPSYDGTYYLEPGSYTYTASAEAYVTQTDVALTIAEEDVNTEKTVTVELEEDTASVEFSIVPAGTTLVVKEGETVIDPTSGTTYDLPIGSYTYTISKEGYVSVEDVALEIVLADLGTSVPVNVSLDEDTAEVVFTLDPTDATLVVKEGETVIDPTSGTTYDLPIGNYTYTVTKTGYVSETDTALVIALEDLGTTVPVSVTLVSE